MFVYVAQEKLRDQGGGEFIGVRKLMRVAFLRSSFSTHNSHKASTFWIRNILYFNIYSSLKLHRASLAMLGQYMVCEAFPLEGPEEPTCISSPTPTTKSHFLRNTSSRSRIVI